MYVNGKEKIALGSSPMPGANKKVAEFSWGLFITNYALRITLRPRDLRRTGKTVFFLNEHTPMRGFGTAGFVGDGDEWEARAERVEDDLAVFACPDFDEIREHVFVFIFARADDDLLPGDGHFVPFPFGGQDGRRTVVRRDDKFEAIGVHRGERCHVTLLFQCDQVRVDPAILLSILDQDPAVSRRASDQPDGGGFVERDQIQVVRAWSIAADDLVRGDDGFQAFHGRDGRGSFRRHGRGRLCGESCECWRREGSGCFRVAQCLGGRTSFQGRG